KFYRDSLDIRMAAEKVSGASFEEFFDRYVAHANPFPYTETLAVAGLELRVSEQRRASFGFVAERAPEGIVIRSVDADSNAAASGVHAGDILVQVNKQEPPRRSDRWLREQKPGDTVHITVRRGDKQMDFDFRLGESKETSYQIAED